MRKSVVVVSYRPGDWLVPCLTSVLEQADEVVLVDNGSEAFDATRLGEQAGARVLRLPSNTGFAPGVNLGVGACTGDVVGLLNDDATAGPDWLATAAESLQDASVAAVGPKIVLSTRYREVRYPDEEWHAPGDARALGRQLRSVTVDGAELLDAAVGPGCTGRRVTPAVAAGAGRLAASLGTYRYRTPTPVERSW